jgi:hypothetical protein
MVLFSDPEEAQRALLEGEVPPGPGCAGFPRTHTAEASSNESWTMPGPAAPPFGWLPQPGTVPTTAIRSGATTATTALPMFSGMPTSACPRPDGPRRRRRALLIRVHRAWPYPRPRRALLPWHRRAGHGAGRPHRAQGALDSAAYVGVESTGRRGLPSDGRTPRDQGAAVALTRAALDSTPVEVLASGSGPTAWSKRARLASHL